MRKINFEEFKNELKQLQEKDILIQISKIIDITKRIRKAQIIINSNRIFISDENNEEINIDINNISNFYKEDEKLKCEFDNWLEILIYEEK